MTERNAGAHERPTDTDAQPGKEATDPEPERVDE